MQTRVVPHPIGAKGLLQIISRAMHCVVRQLLFEVLCGDLNYIWVHRESQPIRFGEKKTFLSTFYLGAGRNRFLLYNAVHQVATIHGDLTAFEP